MAKHITLRSPLDPVALATRLKERVPDKIDRGTPAQVIGRGSEQQMTFWYHRPNFRNDLAARLVATIEPDGSGSRIEGRIGTPTFGFVFLGCWLTFVAAFVLGAVAAAIAGAPLAMVAPFLAIPGAMLVFGALFAWLATRSARRDTAMIVDYLAKTVDAH